MKHYGPRFAVSLCRWIGHCKPLIERLRDPTIQKDQHELEYLADVLANPNHKWPTPGQVAESRKQLHRAAVYLEFLWRGGRCGKKLAAEYHVCDVFEIDRRTVQRSLKYAKRLAD